MTLAVNIAQSGSNNQTFRNRIINGAMTIDQRNNGASSVTFTALATFPVDRFAGFALTDGTMTAQQSTNAPSGFRNSIICTTTVADSSIAAGQYACLAQFIEGFNTADLMWGTANAQTVTLSFWVRSSLTGTFGGAFSNDAYNRSYAFTYTINSANTWEYKTITIVGDTEGTWNTTNGSGIRVFWGLGVGSNLTGAAGSWAGTQYLSANGAVSVIGTLNATFQVTGVQLEEGTAASPFEFRQYGTELQLCQRYYQRYQSSAQSYPLGAFGYVYGLTNIAIGHSLPVALRSTPTITFNNVVTRGGKINGVNDTYALTSISDVAWLNTNQITYTAIASAGVLAEGSIAALCNNAPANSTSFLAYSSEL